MAGPERSVGGVREIPLEPGELLPMGALDGEKPDRQRFMEASGNEEQVSSVPIIARRW